MVAVPGFGAQLGLGVNTLTGETRGFAVKESEPSRQPFRGQETVFYIREIEHREQLRQHLGISASASYSGLFKFDAKSQWSHDTTINSRYFYLLISVAVKNDAIQLPRYELADGPRAMLAKKPYDWKAFYARYGDSFIYSIVTGGEFHALYEFQTRSRKEKDDLKVAARGSYGGFKASAEFQKKMEKFEAETNVSVDWHVNGGEGRLPDPLDPKKLLQAALSFPQAVHPKEGAPVSFLADTKDFLVAEGFPAGEEVPFYGAITDENQEVFARLARLNDRVGDALETVTGGPYPGDLRETISQLSDKLRHQAGAIAKDPFERHEYPTELAETFEGIRRQLIWRPMPGGLVRIAVAGHAHVWGLDRDDKIFRWDATNEKWEEKPGRLSGISVAPDGFVCGVNRDGQAWAWDMGKNKWNAIPAANVVHLKTKARLLQISAGSAKDIWGLTTDGFVVRWTGTMWEAMQHLVDGKPPMVENYSAVSVGNDRTLWLLDRSHRAIRWIREKGRGEPVPGDLKMISVADATRVWAITTDNRLVKWAGKEWESVPGDLTDVSVATDGTVWGITKDGSVVRFEED